MLRHEVSIIMPCYNAGQYVKDAIESVLTQNVPVQLLVVDDGSTDDTLEVLDRYSACIQVLQSEHLGVANARNKAIPHISGRYCLLLDADDALSPGSLGSLLQQAGKDNNKVVYGDFSSWDKSMRNRLRLHRPKRVGRSPLSYLVRAGISPPGAILFPSDAFARVGNFDQAVASCEDWDLTIRLARAGYRYTKLDREVFFYRRLPSSASNQITTVMKSGLEVIGRCHRGDSRISGDLYPDGFQKEKLDINLFYYHVNCMALAALAPSPDTLRELLQNLSVPPGVNWWEFGRIFQLSLWWNSLAQEGDQSTVVQAALTRSITLIKQVTSDRPWSRNMLFGVMTPDLRSLLLRPGPKKALRMYREWKAAREAYKQLMAGDPACGSK